MKSLKGIRRGIRKRLRKDDNAYIENCMNDLNVLETIGWEIYDNMREMQMYYSYEEVFNHSVALRFQEVALSYIFFRNGIEFIHYGSVIEDIMDMIPVVPYAEDLLIDRMYEMEYEESPTLCFMDQFGFKKEILGLDEVMEGNLKEETVLMAEDLKDVLIRSVEELKGDSEEMYGYFIILTRPGYTKLLDQIATYSKIYADKLDRRIRNMYYGDMYYDFNENDIQFLLSFVKGEEFNGNCEISFKNETLFVAFILMVFEEWVFMREKGWIGNGSGGS